MLASTCKAEAAEAGGSFKAAGTGKSHKGRKGKSTERREPLANCGPVFQIVAAPTRKLAKRRHPMSMTVRTAPMPIVLRTISSRSMNVIAPLGHRQAQRAHETSLGANRL